MEMEIFRNGIILFWYASMCQLINMLVLQEMLCAYSEYGAEIFLHSGYHAGTAGLNIEAIRACI